MFLLLQWNGIDNPISNPGQDCVTLYMIWELLLTCIYLPIPRYELDVTQGQFTVYSPGLLAGPCGIRVGWGIEYWYIRSRKAPNLGHLRVGELQSLSPLYSTRPCCLVQAITRHTCPDPNLDSWNCLPH